jgi:hypothetical protein
MSDNDRRWMYDEWSKSRVHSRDWMTNTQAFIDYAFSRATHGTARCPCSRCRNSLSHDKIELTLHLCRFGFMPGYEVWVYHGEVPHVNLNASAAEGMADAYDKDRMDEMLDDLGAQFNLDPEEPPTPEVEQFFELLKAAEQPLHDYTKVTILETVTNLMAIKSQFTF